MHTNKNIRKPTASNKQHWLVESLENFFTKKAKHQQHMEHFLRLVEKGAPISLRVIDWFVTNYSREHDIKYMVVSPDDGHKRMFNVHESYKVQLKAYSKRQFDPFCRRQRILFHYETRRNGKKEIQHIRTTIGQLNFFKWAIGNKVIDYIEAHTDKIEEAMRQFVRAQREEKRKHKMMEKNGSNNTVKAKARRRGSGPNGQGNHLVSGTNKTLRKGSIVTNHVNTTVFFS